MLKWQKSLNQWVQLFIKSDIFNFMYSSIKIDENVKVQNGY